MTTQAPRVTLLVPTARRDDSGRTCKDCGREYLPTDGNKYCPECAKGKGW